MIAAHADRPAATLSAGQAASAIVCLTNEARAANGVGPLVLNSLLSNAANAHGRDAVAQQWWLQGADWHTSPQGTTPRDRVLATGYCPGQRARVIGENLYWAWGQPVPTARAAVNGWLSSPPHRANLLDARFLELGVAVVPGAPQPGTFANAAVFVQDLGMCG